MLQSQPQLEDDHNRNKRKFSLVIHPENSPPNNNSTKAYDISHPYKNDITKSLTKDKKELKGRRPLTGNLMMLEQPKDIPVIKVRSMSCPLPLISGLDVGHFVRKSSGSGEDKLKEAYNAKYVEKLKRDLMDFYKLNNNNLEEEVIAEDDEEGAEFHFDDESRELHEDDDDDEEELKKEDEMNSRMLSSCISNHSSSLTPPLEDSELDISARTTYDDDHKSSVTSENYCDQPLTSKSSMTSIYTTHSIVSTEGKICNRHHHRRPSCAIKFEEPQIMEWEKDNNQTDDKKKCSNINDKDGLGDDGNDNHGIFKENYSLQSYVG